MRIGIDISQLAYKGTGVYSSIKKLIEQLLEEDKENEYILFFSSLRRNPPPLRLNQKTKIKKFNMPPTLLDFIWNRLHILPIEKLIGNIDLFITSDWTEPPSKSKKITFIHDLVVYKFPNETHNKIVKTHKRKLAWSVKECSAFICPSEATKEDIIEIFKISEKKIHVIPWGV